MVSKDVHVSEVFPPKVRHRASVIKIPHRPEFANYGTCQQLRLISEGVYGQGVQRRPKRCREFNRHGSAYENIFQLWKVEKIFRKRSAEFGWVRIPIGKLGKTGNGCRNGSAK
jgi:hypothetical protein